MKLICTQENLKSALTAVSRIITTSNTLPILNNILLKTENGQLKLSATNLELGINTIIRCKIETEGSVCIPAKTFTELVNNLPNTNITISTEESEAEITTEHYRTKIKTLPSDEFPVIPAVENGDKISFDAQTLRLAIEAVMFSVSTSETQPEISGVLMLQKNKTVKFVATDRYRLAEKTLPGTDANEGKNVIIPQKTALEIARVLASASGETQLIISENQIAINTADTHLISRLIDGQYPDYQQIIPQNFNTTISVERVALANALKTSGIFSRATGSVTMKYGTDKQTINISATSSEVGESQVELPGEITGETGTVILNYRYVLDALNNMTTETVVIKIQNESAPVIFLPQGDNSYVYLVMPIKS